MEDKFDSLESMCELIVDCPHSTPEWTDEGIIVLRNQNIRNGVLDLSTPSYTNEGDYQKRIKRAVPHAGDIVFTREAPMGEVCLIPEGLKCCLGQRQVLLRPKKGISGEYLFWALQSPYVQHQISWNEGTGTTVSNVRIPVLKALQIPRYPKFEADIAKHLSALAHRIELNRQTNQTLEQMAQALFKSWFVDFDPVIDNALAAGNDIPDALQHKAELRLQAQQLPDFRPLPDDIRALFPNEFEQTPEPKIGVNGCIPKGWRAGKLFSLAKFTSSSTVGVDLTVDNYISTENMLSNKGGVTKASSVPEIKKVPAYKPGDILISNIRPYFQKIWFSNASGGRSNDVLGIEAIEKECKEFLFNLLYQDAFFDFMMTTSKGSKMPRGDKKAIMDWAVVIPPNELKKFFSNFVKDYFRVIPVRNKEIKELEKIRDILLPKLISGELTLNKEVA